MTAEHISEARITPFPEGEGVRRVERLLDALASLADETGTVADVSHAEIAARMGASVRTVGRALADARRQGLVTTRGHSTRLEYGLLVRPRRAASAGSGPVPLRRAAGAPDLGQPRPPSDNLGHDAVRGARPTSATQPVASRARGSSSSSSSSDLGHPFPAPASDMRAEASPAATAPQGIADSTAGAPSPRRAGSGRDGGDDGDGGERELTPRGALLALFGVEPDAEMARKWAELSDEGRAIAREQAHAWPSKHLRPPPRWMHAVLDSAAVHQTREHVAPLAGPQPVPSAPAEPRPAAQPSTSSAPSTRPRPRAGGWRSLARGALAVAVGVADRALCGGALTGGGR